MTTPTPPARTFEVELNGTKNRVEAPDPRAAMDMLIADGTIAQGRSYLVTWREVIAGEEESESSPDELMARAFEALRKSGLTQRQSMDAIHHIYNEGIQFRGVG